MSDASRKELHELVNALPPGEEQAARRYLEYLRDAADPYAHLEADPFVDMTDAERAKLHASLRQAEAEIAAGKSTAAEDLLRELRAGK
jgi:acyl dehydratase